MKHYLAVYSKGQRVSLILGNTKTALTKEEAFREFAKKRQFKKFAIPEEMSIKNIYLIKKVKKIV
jgi:hypothetical protein